MGEYLFSKRRDHPLGRGGQQIDLNEVHHALKREQRDEAERNSIEKCPVVLLEGSVEQMTNDLRKREPNSGRHQQTQSGDGQTSTEGSDPWNQLAEWFWRTQTPR